MRSVREVRRHATRVPIAKIRMDGGTQPRAALDFDAIDDYSEEIVGGAKFPPVIVYYDGEDYWLADGFHRVKAAWQAGLDTVHADVHQGTLEDAQWHSFSANKTNGLRRTTQDKQRAIKAALLHPNGAGRSDSQIAKHVGVAVQTVSNWRKQLESSFQIGKIETRTVTRGGRTYQQNTANIGQGSPARVEHNQPVPSSEPVPAPDGPPATSVLMQAPRPQTDCLETHLSRAMQAMEEILACPLSPNDFYACLAQQPTQATLIKTMENLNELISQVLAEARRTAITT